jgi:membrane associated rhomboid family serine protease
MPGTQTQLSEEEAFYRKKLLLSILIPAIFIIIMWLVKVTELLFEADFSEYGIYPLTLKGLPGIFLSPFIHADFEHLFNNTIPLFFLSSCIFYFYSEVALRVFAWTYFLTGLLVWIFGREAWHIGASGLIYGFASFLFFSGIIRRHLGLTALSLLIIFLYGSMIWGMVPLLYKNVSWESHMLGTFSGVILAIWFRNEGPQRPVYQWMEEEEKNENNSPVEQS